MRRLARNWKASRSVAPDRRCPSMSVRSPGRSSLCFARSWRGPFTERLIAPRHRAVSPPHDRPSTRDRTPSRAVRKVRSRTRRSIVVGTARLQPLGATESAYQTLFERHVSSILPTRSLLPHFLATQYIRKNGCGRRIRDARKARRIKAGPFDERILDAPAGDVRQLGLADEDHLGAFMVQRICDDATERQGGDKGNRRPLGGCGSGCCP